MAYVGNTPTTQSFIAGTDYFNGDGSTVAFTLSRSVTSPNDIQATVNNVVQQPNTAYTVSGTTITFTSAPSSGSSNIYVRYLSTTTQAITPSQNTVSYSTLNSDTQSKLGISFKNRIINGDFRVSQYNGTSSFTTTTNGQYVIDRWNCGLSQSSKFTVQQNAGSITPPAGFSYYAGLTVISAATVGSGDYFRISQPIEGLNVADLNWGTVNAKNVTLSFWVYSSLTGTYGGSFQNGAGNRAYPFQYTISAANTWTQISITVPGDQSGTWYTNNGTGLQINFGLGVGSTYTAAAGSWASGLYVSANSSTNWVSTNGATFYLTGVQLEVNTQATTFDYRDYGRELILCQRYFWRITGGVDSGSGIYAAVGSGFSPNTGYGRIIIPMNTQMRTTPTLSYNGAVYIENGGGAPAITGINVNYGGRQSAFMSASVASSFTANVGVICYTGGTTSDYIQGSAEL